MPGRSCDLPVWTSCGGSNTGIAMQHHFVQYSVAAGSGAAVGAIITWLFLRVVRITVDWKADKWGIEIRRDDEKDQERLGL